MEREKTSRPSYAEVRREMVKAVLNVRRYPADEKRRNVAKQATSKWARMAHQSADKALLGVCEWLTSPGAPEEVDLVAHDGRYLDEAVTREEFRRKAAQHQTWLRKGMDRLPPEEWAQLRNAGVTAAQLYCQTAITAALVAAGCEHTLDLLVRSACVAGLDAARAELRLTVEGGSAEMYRAIEAYALRACGGGSGDWQLAELLWEAMAGSQQVYLGEVGDLAIQRLESAYGALTDAEVMQLAAEEPARIASLQAAMAAEEAEKTARKEKRRAAKRRALEKARSLEERAAAKAAARAEEEEKAAKEPAAAVDPREAELVKALQCHDWYYSFSDDHSVWKRGNAHRKEIEAMVSALGVRGAELWNEHKPSQIGAKYVPKPKVAEPVSELEELVEAMPPEAREAWDAAAPPQHEALRLPEVAEEIGEEEVAGFKVGTLSTSIEVSAEPRYEVVLRSWNGVEWVTHTSYLKPGETLDLTDTGWQIVSQGWTS